MKENPDLSIQHDHSYIDIISQGTNKKSGIATLLSKLESSRVQVIGDGENDIPMFETTDESFSFYDAPDVVKEKANYLVDCYDEIFET
ncbi:HAD hydrolase family protein [Lactococcus laudensis]|uniref:HAD hydrolase family protein n=1 Tax=Pseudolactococcus laudensis TaxID=1494461 RepID=UPI002FC96F65